MADQAINALSTKTAPETSDQLLLVGTGEPQLIDYDKLADAILNKITSKNYALDAGTMTLPAALNALNGKSKRVPDNNSIYLSPIITVSSNDWCEIATFECYTWNISTFMLFVEHSIYGVSFGYDLNGKTYLSRSDGINLITSTRNSKIGFKVIDNVLHIYYKKKGAINISVACIGATTENSQATFSLSGTELSDSDMDKIC